MTLESAPQPTRVRGGQVGNLNAAKHYKHTVKGDLKVLTAKALDGRTDEARFIEDRRDRIVSDLGGIEAVTTARAIIVEEACHTALHLRRINVWIASRQPSLVNRRTKAVHPVVMQRAKLAETLAGLLVRLGLERQARDVDTLDAEAAAVTGGTGHQGAPEAAHATPDSGANPT